MIALGVTCCGRRAAPRRQSVPDAAFVILEALENHVVKLLLDELAKMSPSDEQFAPKVAVLIQAVRQHIEREEGGSSPACGRAGVPASGSSAMPSARNIASERHQLRKHVSHRLRIDGSALEPDDNLSYFEPDQPSGLIIRMLLLAKCA